MKIQKYSQFVKESKNIKRALIISGNGFQDEELFQPKKTLENNEIEVVIASNSLGKMKAYNNDSTIEVQTLISDLRPEDFDILILPGGKAPEYLKNDESVLNFVKSFYQTGKPIAAICHGPLILASAGLVSGKNMTCYKDAKEELVSSGANYEDSSCVIDGQFITSRNPDDLKGFCQNILESI